MPLPTASTEDQMIAGLKALADEFTDRLQSYERGVYRDMAGPNG